ncbi:hypothetical protein [Spiroplasma endosymbiont of Atherix ibis]|uniref:hypothetical protein n=1 Tax=Spiroplasma endosymbiont of Atherix ibis TaxID=3066291 RepID=UPI0030D0964A
MTEETKVDEIIQETAPETSEELDKSKSSNEEENQTEEVQFSDEQKAKINEIIKENINNKNIEILALQDSLKDKDYQIQSLNNQLIQKELFSQNLDITDTQLEFIKQLVNNFTFANIEEIVRSVKELIGKQVEIVDEQDFGGKKEKIYIDPSNPLGLE